MNKNVFHLRNNTAIGPCLHEEPAWVNLDDAQIVIVLLMMYKHARKVRFVAQP